MNFNFLNTKGAACELLPLHFAVRIGVFFMRAFHIFHSELQVKNIISDINFMIALVFFDNELNIFHACTWCAKFTLARIKFIIFDNDRCRIIVTYIKQEQTCFFFELKLDKRVFNDTIF